MAGALWSSWGAAGALGPRRQVQEWGPDEGGKGGRRLACDLARSTSILAAGCSTFILFRMVAPSFVMITSPSACATILSMPRGPRLVRMASATALAASMFISRTSFFLALSLHGRWQRGGPPRRMHGAGRAEERQLGARRRRRPAAEAARQQRNVGGGGSQQGPSHWWGGLAGLLIGRWSDIASWRLPVTLSLAHCGRRHPCQASCRSSSHLLDSGGAIGSASGPPVK